MYTVYQCLIVEQLRQGEISMVLLQFWAVPFQLDVYCQTVGICWHVGFGGVTCFKHVCKCLIGPSSSQKRQHTFEQCWTPLLDVGHRALNQDDFCACEKQPP